MRQVVAEDLVEEAAPGRPDGVRGADRSWSEYGGRTLRPEGQVATKKQKARATAAGKEIPGKPKPKKKTSRGK